MQLEAINQALFQVLNAPADLAGLRLGLATVAAKGAIVFLTALLTWNWISAKSGERCALAQLALAVPVAMALNYVIGLLFPHPRPFMIGLGHTFLSHRPESSFPSDHASLMWTAALGMLTWSRSKWASAIAIVLAALTSWARVFLGLHFPFDIVGSMLVAVVAVGALVPLRSVIERAVAQPIETWCVSVAHGLAMRWKRHPTTPD